MNTWLMGAARTQAQAAPFYRSETESIFITWLVMFIRNSKTENMPILYLSQNKIFHIQFVAYNNYHMLILLGLCSSW
jgi:hypothetical protein